VRVFSGVDGEELRRFDAYHPAFSGGVFVAAGDVDGDGYADIITGAGAGGGPHVRVLSGADNSEIFGFFAYHPSFTGGVHVAAGDVDGDGHAEVVTGAGAGGGPHVRILNGTTGAELFGFFAYHPHFSGGVFVAAENVTGDGRAEIITGAGAGGGPHVRILNGQTGADLGGFYAFDISYSGGAPVAVGNAQVFASGNPSGEPLARAFNTNGAMLRQFSSLGDDFVNGAYVAAGAMSVLEDPDDEFEDNDTLAQAADLGTLDETHSLEGLHLLDAADWFQLHLESAAAEDAYVHIEFLHSQGDVDMAVYNASGSLVRLSDSVSNSEQVSLNGLGAGDYYIKVYGYQGVFNPDYSLTVEAGASSGGGAGGGGGSAGGPNVLYVNFDGATITASDLSRWAAGQWNPNDLPGNVSNGITVNAFFAGRSDREEIISSILSRLQADLSPFGITVQRHTGLAVENVSATTLFAGRSTLTHPHVACDIDFGNNNSTDIAFIGEENWGTADNIALAMSDVFLHEAGHTFGLYHVQVVQNGTLYPESMGLRYSSSQDQWLRDTSFMDRTFIEYRDENGYWHGPGGGQSQNTYRTMLGNFGLAAPVFSGNLATVDSSQAGTLVVTGSAAADRISVVQLEGGVELSINGQQYTITGDLEQLVINTLSDPLDQVQVTGDLTFQLLMGQSGAAKLDAEQISFWNGSALSNAGLGCCCPLCRSAVESAYSNGAEDFTDLTAALSALSELNGGEPANLETPAADASVVLHQLSTHPSHRFVSPNTSPWEVDSEQDAAADRCRSANESLFALEALEQLLASELA
jgi:hypothetical protein